MTVIETDCGKILGGYAHCSWGAPGYGYGESRNSPDAFLFLFLKQQSHPIKMEIKDADHAIFADRGLGPTYGERRSFGHYSDEYGHDLQVDGDTLTVAFGHTFGSEISEYHESPISSRHRSTLRKYTIKEMEVFQVCKIDHVEKEVELEADLIPLSDSFAPPLNEALNNGLEALLTIVLT